MKLTEIGDTIELDGGDIEITFTPDGSYDGRCFCRVDISKYYGTMTTDQWRQLRDWINTHILKETT